MNEISKELIKEVIREMVVNGELQVGWSEELLKSDNIVLKVRDKDGVFLQEDLPWAGIEVLSSKCNCR